MKIKSRKPSRAKTMLIAVVIAVILFCLLDMMVAEHPPHAVWTGPDTVEIDGQLYRVKKIESKRQ